MKMHRAMAVLALAVAAGCGGARLPQTNYYRLVAPEWDAAPEEDHPELAAREGAPVLVIEELEADAAYDDPRMVYRESPYRVDYYHYHRWTTYPGQLVSDFLVTAYRRTGLFERVATDYDDQADAILVGRVVSLAEVDVTPEQWIGELELELELRDAVTDAPLWNRRVREVEPLASRTPEALAQAISRALARVVERTAAEIAAAAAEDRRGAPPRSVTLYRPPRHDSASSHPSRGAGRL